MVYRANEEEVDFYVNGQLFETIVQQLNVTNGQIVLGGSTDLGLGVFHDGNIDDISVWNIALTQSEIEQYMNCPPTGDEAGLIGYWNFEEGSGTTALDLTANGNNGTINGAT